MKKFSNIFGKPVAIYRFLMYNKYIMKYIVVMHGTTGEYRTEYDSEARAESAADNIRGLGYEAEVIKQAATFQHKDDEE